MVKHTQRIRRQQPTNCLSVFDHFVGFVLNLLSANHTQMVKHTQTIRRQFLDELFECV